MITTDDITAKSTRAVRSVSFHVTATLNAAARFPAHSGAAARRCGRAPAECVMVGDSRLDVLAGRAAGMVTCGYVAGFSKKAELVEAGADVLIEHFGELRKVFSEGLIAHY